MTLMTPIKPFWFLQRQGTLEEVGENIFRVHAPNLREAFTGVRAGNNGRWAGFMRLEQAGPDIAATEPVFERQADAWDAAFELYRREVIV